MYAESREANLLVVVLYQWRILSAKIITRVRRDRSKSGVLCVCRGINRVPKMHAYFLSRILAPPSNSLVLNIMNILFVVRGLYFYHSLTTRVRFGCLNNFTRSKRHRHPFKHINTMHRDSTALDFTPLRVRVRVYVRV